jgi:hypothetical protein
MFEVGNRVINTGNHNRKLIGIITRVIDADLCEVLWSADTGYVYTGIIRRDGTVEYVNIAGHEADRIVRVDLSVRIRQEV